MLNEKKIIFLFHRFDHSVESKQTTKIFQKVIKNDITFHTQVFDLGYEIDLLGPYRRERIFQTLLGLK